MHNAVLVTTREVSLKVPVCIKGKVWQLDVLQLIVKEALSSKR